LADIGLQAINVDLSELFNQADLPAEHVLEKMPSALSGILILNLNAPETVVGLRALRLYAPRRWRGIGAWVWELETASSDWLPISSHLTEIWVPSTFVMAAFAPLVKVPVRIVPYFIKIPDDIRPERSRYAISNDDVVILSMADGRSSFDR